MTNRRSGRLLVCVRDPRSGHVRSDELTCYPFAQPHCFCGCAVRDTFAVIDAAAVVVAALVAAQLMEVPAYLQRALGLPVRQDIFDEAGSILRAPKRWRRLVGWLGHAVLAVGIVLLYAAFFAAVAGNDHLAWWGIFAGVVHGVLGGVVVGAFTDLHPRMPLKVPAPGVFYRHYGRRDVITFVAGHLWFGLVAGVVYAALHADLAFEAAF